MSENEHQVIMVRYSLIYVGTKDRQHLTFIHLTKYFKPSVSSVEILCKVMFQRAVCLMKILRRLQNTYECTKLVSVFSLVSIPVRIRQKWSSVDVVRFQGSSDFRSFCDLIFRTTLRKLISKQRQLPLQIKEEKAFLFQTWKDCHYR